MLFPQCPFICAFVLGWILKQMMEFFPPIFLEQEFLSREIFFIGRKKRQSKAVSGMKNALLFLVCLVSIEMSIIICTIKKRVCESVALYDTCFKTSNLPVPISALIVLPV